MKIILKEIRANKLSLRQWSMMFLFKFKLFYV
jgi:hypothetical protein